MSIVRITILVDNYVRRRSLLAEHGWACWVETPAERLLFDTGQGQTLRHNAGELGVPLATATSIALSHGHYDHTGGLAAALELAPTARVLAHPAALEAKYKRGPDGCTRAIGLPDQLAERCARLAACLVATRTPTQVGPGLWLTGEVPRVTDFEQDDSAFRLDAAGQKHDPLADDQALVVRCAAGLVVVLGCAHAGVINTLRFVQTLHPGVPLTAVLGGMHLYGAPEQRVAKTISELAALGVGRVIPAHCTGRRALAAFAAGLPDRCTPGEVGTALEFELGGI